MTFIVSIVTSIFVVVVVTYQINITELVVVYSCHASHFHRHWFILNGTNDAQISKQDHNWRPISISFQYWYQTKLIERRVPSFVMCRIGHVYYTLTCISIYVSIHHVLAYDTDTQQFMRDMAIGIVPATTNRSVVLRDIVLVSGNVTMSSQTECERNIYIYMQSRRTKMLCMLFSINHIIRKYWLRCNGRSVCMLVVVGLESRFSITSWLLLLKRVQRCF